jgi:Protein of unknown function (DUF559)
MEWLEPQDFSKHLRKAMTPAEYLLWQRLRNRQRSHAKFRRQYVKGIYTLDFFCPEATENRSNSSSPNPFFSLVKILAEKRKKPATVHYTIAGLNT